MLADQRLQGLAVDVLHDDPRILAFVEEVVDGDDDRVPDLGQRLRLDDSALPGGRQVLATATGHELLKRDEAVEPAVPGQPDTPHSPRAELPVLLEAPP